ncbi:MAG: trypsin-like peptidase domain-containing protein [Planctomycetes bacterium]|nr:trypsin-like peptidase domain-containing protein [Planctomycetota bacterium]
MNQHNLKHKILWEISFVIAILLTIPILIKLDVFAQVKPPPNKGSSPLKPADTPNFTKKSISDVAKFVIPSTVQIINLVEQKSQFQGEKGQLIPRGTGTGSIINKEGIILTNSHVVNGASALLVMLSDERQLPATLIGEDVKADVAVIKIDNPPADIIPIKLGDSDKLEIGDWAVAIGNPFRMRNTVTTGIISALNQPQSAEVAQEDLLYIQTDAPINPGNSGGPLVNMQGEVIGINSWIYNAGAGGSIGLGFAIPINAAKEIMQSLITDKKSFQRYVGVELWQINTFLAYSYNHKTLDDFLRDMKLKETTGGFVKNVEPGSPAAETGLKEGDVIIEFDKAKINSPREYSIAISKHKPGDTVDIKVIQSGEIKTLKLTIGKK